MKTQLNCLFNGLALFAGLTNLHASAAFTTLVSFTGTNGPNYGSLQGNMGGALVAGNDGNFYGTTHNGGMEWVGTNLITDHGTLFKMTPSGEFTSLYFFAGRFTGPNNGYGPVGNLIKGADGHLYGNTIAGGLPNCGTAFQITTNGQLTTLYAFGSYPGGYDAHSQGTNYDGYGPWKGLLQGSDGNFYGTTDSGGASGTGTVFRITPDGSLTTLHSFSLYDSSGANADGFFPLGELIEGTDGNFYGTTASGGSAGFILGGLEGGTIYQITPGGIYTVLHHFTGGDDGNDPLGGLVQGRDGCLYGTASRGGGAGTAFRITTNGIFTTLHAFDYTGAHPSAALVQGSDGNFYGTTADGGATFGTVFQMTTNGTVTILHAFNGLDGWGPTAQLVQGSDGSFYGTTTIGGAGYVYNSTYGMGTIFRIIIPPLLQSITPTNGAVTLTWSVMPGQTCQLQSTTDLSSTNWINLGSAVTATNTTVSATDPATNNQCFYRIKLLP